MNINQGCFGCILTGAFDLKIPDVGFCSFTADPVSYTHLAKEIATQAEKKADGLSLTQAQLTSFLVMAGDLRTDRTGPLYSPADLNLLILFKYCFSEGHRDKLLDLLKKPKQRQRKEPEENV